MKRITIDEIEEKYRIERYQDLYDKIVTLMENNQLKPVYVAGKNGKKPTLYKEYWIVEEQEDNSQYIDELSYFFVPDMETKKQNTE